MSLLARQVPKDLFVSDRCPHHKADSSFECIFRAFVGTEWQSVNLAAQFDERVTRDELRVFRCLFCGHPVLVHVAYVQTIEPRGTKYQPRILYPDVERPKMAEEAPRSVAGLWEEAATCMSIGAWRGAAACLRGAVEQIAKEQGAAGKDLKERINALAATGLDQDLIDGLHDTRLTGNWSLHDAVKFAPAEIEDLSQLVEDTVKILYVQPAQRKAMAEARAKRRRGNGQEPSEPPDAGS